jgi:hypothetical protein
MKVIIKYPIELKDENLCLGCPFPKIKEEGKEWHGEFCDCSSDMRCNCSRPYSTRDKDKDLWHCPVFDVSLGIGQIPHRNKKCKIVKTNNALEIKRLENIISDKKKEIIELSKENKKQASEIKKKDKQLEQFTDPKYWAEVVKSNLLKEQ